MKKTLLISMMLLSGLTFAQTEETEVAPQYTVAPEVTQEVAEPLNYDFAFTLSGGLCTADDKDPYVTNMAFLATEWAYYISENHAFTFELGFGYGGDDFGKPEYYNDYKQHQNWYDYHRGENGYDFSYYRLSLNMMAGFRTVIPIMRNLSATVGVKGGVDFQCLSLDHPVDSYYYYDRHEFEHDQVVWCAGLVYAAYVGLNYQFTEKTSVELGYQFRGTTAEPEVTNYWQKGQPTTTAAKLNFHEIKLGVRVKF